MKISVDSRGDFTGSLEWLKTLTSRDPTTSLNRIGSEGAKALQANTPKDTGNTASGWGYKVERKDNISEVSWSNNAHPELNVNLALLLDLGHGTGTGGYVPPRPYINKSMDPLLNSAGDRLFKELTT